MTSAANLAWLRQTGRRYLVGTPKSELRKWAAQLADAQDWQAVRDGRGGQARASGPDGTETFVLIRSQSSAGRRSGPCTSASPRGSTTGLTRLARRLAHARRPLDRGPVERQLGRLLARNPRAAGRYVIDARRGRRASRPACAWPGPPARSGTTGPAGAKAATSSAPTSPTGAPRTCGARTSSSPRPRPPSAFRRASSSIRPIWHQREDRVQGAHPRLLPRLRPVEDPGAVAGAGRASGTARGRSSKNSAASRAPTSCSRRPTAASCACAASSARIRRRPTSWTASASTCPSACASARRSSSIGRNVVPTFSLSPRFPVLDPPRTAEVGLGSASQREWAGARSPTSGRASFSPRLRRR